MKETSDFIQGCEATNFVTANPRYPEDFVKCYSKIFPINQIS